MSIAEGHDPSEGYAPRWGGTEEYIEDITYQIWEQGNVEIIRNVYSEDCHVYTLAGSCTGKKTVQKNTKSEMEQFPGRTMFPAAVFWNGNNTTGYHSSHLISTKMTYHHKEDSESDSEYTLASHGLEARIWVVAHYLIRDGKIVRQWLIRDTQSLYRQLGVCSESVAKSWARTWWNDRLDHATSETCHLAWLSAEFQRVQGEKITQGILKVDLENIVHIVRPMYEYLALRVARLYHQAWGPQGMATRDKFEGLVKQLYHPHAWFESPQTNNTGVTGWEDITKIYDTFVLGNERSTQVAMSLDWIIVKPGQDTRKILSNGSVPNSWRYPQEIDRDLQLQFEKTFINSDQVSESFTLAIRWTICGYKRHGDPEILVPVVLLAESHLECAGFRVIRDITVYDSVAVDAQIQLVTDVVHSLEL